jgi:pimeloyl-ACP methyl ester carboxylesterase
LVTTAKTGVLMSHYSHGLSAPSGAFALIAPEPDCRTAAVFVHGFGGDALGTWATIQPMVDGDSQLTALFADVDLYFFQYPSVFEGMGSSVDRLRRFLKTLVPVVDRTLFDVDASVLSAAESATRKVCVLPEGRTYTNLILVGHSEGGAVIRQMLASLANDASEFGTLCREAGVVLFAPALFGYAPSGLLGLLVNSPVLGGVIEAVLRSSPAYRDLQPDQKNLERLQEKTERLARKGRGRGYVASLLWGRRDRILQDGKYELDTCEYRDGHGHVSICKSTMSYLDPALLVAAAKGHNGRS